MSNPAPEVSIVIPAFNEQKRLGATLSRIRDYFATREPSLAGVEIIVVDDGSTDSTIHVAKEFARTAPCVRVIANGRNRGKGYSVRQGILGARGRVAFFTDADLSSPIEECERLLAAIESGSDIAIGSRAMDRTLIDVHQSRFREIAGIIFNRLVRVFTGLSIEDTQCGFKAFRLPACRMIFEQQRIAGFGFDPEILFLARRHGLRVEEVPVCWSHDPATKVHIYRDSIEMFLDLLRIRINSAIGRYPLKHR